MSYSYILRKINKNKKENYFVTCLFQIRVTGTWSLPQQLRAQGGSNLDRTPFTGPLNTHQHSLRQGQFRHASSPSAHILAMWEETRASRGNPHRHEENMQTAHKQWPCQGINFFFLINIMKWHEPNDVLQGPALLTFLRSGCWLGK